MIFPVLLCGGSGTRLWPLSRKSYPKQFADVIGEHSLFQASALRFQGDDFGAPLVVTGDAFRFIVTEQLAEVGITESGILIEPEGRQHQRPRRVQRLWRRCDKTPMQLFCYVPRIM